MKNLNKKAYQNSLKDRKNWQSIIPIAAFDNAAKYIIELEFRVARLSKKLKANLKVNNKVAEGIFDPGKMGMTKNYEKS